MRACPAIRNLAGDGETASGIRRTECPGEPALALAARVLLARQPRLIRHEHVPLPNDVKNRRKHRPQRCEHPVQRFLHCRARHGHSISGEFPSHTSSRNVVGALRSDVVDETARAVLGCVDDLRRERRGHNADSVSETEHFPNMLMANQSWRGRSPALAWPHRLHVSAATRGASLQGFLCFCFDPNSCSRTPNRSPLVPNNLSLFRRCRPRQY